MVVINKFLFVTMMLAVLTACQPNTHKPISENGTYQCLNATITIAGKPTAVLMEWNTQTGVARLLDSATLTSKNTGAQSVVLGWVPLGELRQVIQEVLQRDQQQMSFPVSPAPTNTVSSVPTNSSVETHLVKPKKN